MGMDIGRMMPDGPFAQREDEIERHCPRFLRLTGMLPPGKDESAADHSQETYNRQEVRGMLWQLFLALEEGQRVRASMAQSVAIEAFWKAFGM